MSDELIHYSCPQCGHINTVGAETTYWACLECLTTNFLDEEGLPTLIPNTI